MENKIVIDNATCILCGKCAKVCPSRILTQNNDTKAIEVNMPEACIRCGHCVAVCPTQSVRHNSFPADKVHAIDYSQYPSADQMMLLCKGRRSNRAFSKKLIPEQSLDLILEAAHRAPTATNSQKVSFVLITSPEHLKMLSEFTLTVFGKIVKLLSFPGIKQVVKISSPDTYKYLPAFKMLQSEFESGNDMIMRNATAAILMYVPKGYRFGAEDANLAYQNASLVAESLGVSQFYTGFVLSATHQQKGVLEKQLGIDGEICAGMALGVPQFRYPNYVDRDDIRVVKL